MESKGDELTAIVASRLYNLMRSPGIWTGTLRIKMSKNNVWFPIVQSLFELEGSINFLNQSGVFLPPKSTAWKVQFWLPVLLSKTPTQLSPGTRSSSTSNSHFAPFFRNFISVFTLLWLFGVVFLFPFWRSCRLRPTALSFRSWRVGWVRLPASFFSPRVPRRLAWLRPPSPVFRCSSVSILHPCDVVWAPSWQKPKRLVRFRPPTPLLRWCSVGTLHIPGWVGINTDANVDFNLISALDAFISSPPPSLLSVCEFSIFAGTQLCHAQAS